MWLAVIYNFRLALLRESDGANKHGAAVARGGISPMSSSPTYSDALHCEQKKWRHYHHLQKFSFSGVFLLVSNGVNPFESESEDICSRLTEKVKWQLGFFPPSVLRALNQTRCFLPCRHKEAPVKQQLGVLCVAPVSERCSPKEGGTKLRQTLMI